MKRMQVFSCILFVCALRRTGYEIIALNAVVIRTSEVRQILPASQHR